MGYPTDGSTLSNHTDQLEEFTGLVQSQFAKDSFMRSLVPVKLIRGTDTIVNKRIGRTTLKKVVPGVRPDASKTTFGRATLTVDTTILARDSIDLLNDFQTDFNVRAALAEDQGKEHAKYFDQAFIIQALKGALSAAPSDVNSIGAGKDVTLSAVGDELDADKLYTGISSVVLQMEQEDIDPSECVCLMLPQTFATLLDNDKLTSADYSVGNGDYAKRILHEVAGMKAVKTNRIPTAAIAAHLLGSAYNVSASEAKAVAVIVHPKSLFAGETIPMQSNMWYNNEELVWFMDTYAAYGVTVGRPDVCGAVFKA